MGLMSLDKSDLFFHLIYFSQSRLFPAARPYVISIYSPLHPSHTKCLQPSRSPPTSVQGEEGEKKGQGPQHSLRQPHHPKHIPVENQSIPDTCPRQPQPSLRLAALGSNRKQHAVTGPRVGQVGDVAGLGENRGHVLGVCG